MISLIKDVVSSDKISLIKDVVSTNMISPIKDVVSTDKISLIKDVDVDFIIQRCSLCRYKFPTEICSYWIILK